MEMNVPMHFTLRQIPGIVLDSALYKKYKRMIDKAAWEASKVCNIEFEEMQSRGNLIFCEATKSYKPGKGAFSTHLGWKLLTLKQGAREMYAPKTCTDERTFWHSLSEMAVGKDGEELSGDPLQASIEYSQKMEEALDDADWESRIPDFRMYMDAMDDDTKMLCNDILDGQFDDAESAGTRGRKAYIAHMSNIPVTRYYSRRYIKLGWSKQRTQRALDNLRQLCRQWMANKLPCSLIRPTETASVELF